VAVAGEPLTSADVAASWTSSLEQAQATSTEAAAGTLRNTRKIRRVTEKILEITHGVDHHGLVDPAVVRAEGDPSEIVLPSHRSASASGAA
jgi:hypothetical protein